MRSIISTGCLLIAALILCACQSVSDRAAPVRVRVLTYNIHHGEGTDQRFDYERLARVIQSLDPDLVALQEVDQKTSRAGGLDQPDELARRTDRHVAFGKTMDYAGGAYGNAVLSRWPILRATTHPLPSSPGHEPRAALAITTRVRSPGPEFQFVSVHLDHTGDESDRLKQATRLNELFSGNEPAPVILAGDLNAVPESKTMQTLFAHWTDAAAANPQPTIPSENPRRRIDFILLRPPNGWRVAETRVLDEPVASDHRPVLAVLEWMGAKSRRSSTATAQQSPRSSKSISSKPR